jgi:transposase-like protein
MAQGRRTRAQWRQLVEGFSGSGLTQACYCERHGISVTSFQRWRAQFRQHVQVNPGFDAATLARVVRLLQEGTAA